MKKIFSMFVSLMVMLMPFANATPALAATVGSNGSFETGTDPGSFVTLTSVDSTSITNWTVDSGSVDYIGTYWSASEGSRSIDLNSLAMGSISQTLATVSGATYNVTFDMSGNPDNQVATPLTSPGLKEMSVSAVGISSQNFSYDTVVKGNSLGNMLWENHTYSFVATGTSTTLTFASMIAGAFGPALDNVVIEETPPPQCNANATQTIVSDTTTDVNGNPSVLTWVHPAWARIVGASWIWNETQVSDPTLDHTNVFTKTFNIVGSVTSANLEMASDNGYKVEVNNVVVVDNLGVENSYSPTANYNITSYLTTGSNTLKITVKNFALANSTYDTNPAGLIYKLVINNNECVVPPPPTGSLIVTKTTIGGDGTFNFTGIGSGFDITTNSGTGNETLSNLAPGPYLISETPQDHWQQVSNGCENVTVVAGQEVECTITNKHDARITVTKTTVGGQGSFHFTNSLNQNELDLNTTDQQNNQASGFFDIFTEIDGSPVTITENPTTGWTATQTSCTLAIVKPGDNLACSFTNTKLGTISGMKYNDKNRNGHKNTGEEGLAGWIIKLKLGNTVITTTTDAGGNYSFNNIAPGTYKVRETHQNGWKRKSKNPKPIVIIAGSDVKNVDFGNAKKYKHEREDNDNDDNHDEQHGHYFGNHGRSNYEND